MTIQKRDSDAVSLAKQNIMAAKLALFEAEQALEAEQANEKFQTKLEACGDDEDARDALLDQAADGIPLAMWQARARDDEWARLQSIEEYGYDVEGRARWMGEPL